MFVYSFKLLHQHSNDPILINLTQDVIFNLSCATDVRNATYTGKSSRCLEVRVKDHSMGTQNNIKLHILETNHPIIIYLSV